MSDQDLNIVSRVPSPVMEYIVQTETSISEPNDIRDVNDFTQYTVENPILLVTENREVKKKEIIPEENDGTESTGQPKKGRKRKYESQNRTIRKKKANLNEDYVSVNGKVVHSKKFNGNTFNCNCPRKCTEKLTVEQRLNEFETFWGSGTFEARCAMLQNSVKESQKLRSYSHASKRVYTRRYYLCGIEICKKAYLNTLGISQSRIDIALKKFKSQAPITDKRGIKSGGRNAISQEKLNNIRQFIEGLPKYTSHNCKDKTANYLAPNLNLAILYNLYREKHENPVSLSKFKHCFYNDFNLRFKKPQKDTCFHCDSFKASKKGAKNNEEIEILQKQHKEHINQAHRVRDHMKRDLSIAKSDASVTGPQLKQIIFMVESRIRDTTVTDRVLPHD